jgi:hypothetical protein
MLIRVGEGTWPTIRGATFLPVGVSLILVVLGLYWRSNPASDPTGCDAPGNFQARAVSNAYGIALPAQSPCPPRRRPG